MRIDRRDPLGQTPLCRVLLTMANMAPVFLNRHSQFQKVSKELKLWEDDEVWFPFNISFV